MEAAEFFAGIGLARMGIEQAGFRVAWSNDHSAAKQTMYAGQFGGDGHRFVLGDVGAITGSQMPVGLSMAWASFPCTDLSLAGARDGIRSGESKTFWELTRIIGEMGDAKPAVLALENVVGLATSRGGRDLESAVRELNRLGYSVDVLTLDARRFVAQSRPRLFLIGALHPPGDGNPDAVSELRPAWLQAPFDDPDLITHRMRLPCPPPARETGLSRHIEEMGDDDPRWWDAGRVEAFAASMSPVQAARVRQLSQQPGPSWRTAYRRTRAGVAVWELRADSIAGCLRTARGGSSRQAVARIDGRGLRVRWMTPREYASLMGAPSYRLDGVGDSHAISGFGDAVCVPVIAWLAEHCLAPLVRQSDAMTGRGVGGHSVAGPVMQPA